MSVSESRRYRLYEVQARLDKEAAETLMELLPPVGWSDVATKHDLAHLERRIDGVEIRLSRVEDRLDSLRSSFIGWLLASQATVVAVVIGAATILR